MIDIPELERTYKEVRTLKGDEKLCGLRKIKHSLHEFEKAAAVDWETITRDSILKARELLTLVTGGINILEAAASRRG